MSVSAGERLSMEQSGTATTELTEADVPGFAAVEIAADESLQERISADSALDVGQIADTAEQKLAADEAKAEAAQAVVDAAAEDLAAE